MMRMLLIPVLCALLAAVPAHAAGADGIAAVVNDKPIPMSAVADRMKLVMVSSGMPDTGEVREKVQPQVVSMLIDEALRLQEADKQKIVVDDAAIDAGLADIAGQNNMTVDQFTAVLHQSGINSRSLREQLRAQIAWTRIVQERLMRDIEISEFDVDSMMEQLTGNIGKNEYLAAEIFLPVDAAAEEGDVRQLADRLQNQLRSGQVRFSAVAMQFSQAAGASKGGDLGWVQEGQLDPALDAALAQLEPGQISPPVRTLTGYHILLVREKRTTTADTIPPREDVFNRIGMQALDRAQRRHFLNLKAASFIDRRGV